MRRFVTLLVLLVFSIPFGVSISGCSKNSPPVFCNGGDSGPITGQATTITLNPIVYGVSLNFAEIGQVNSPAATDCKGNGASVGTFTYGTTDMTIADIQPNTGRLCGGTWNRNSGGGIPDYTYCTPTNKSGTAYVSASADGVTSNPLPIFVHPVVTSIVLGGPSSNCATDPTTNCSPASINTSASSASCATSATYPSNPLLANGCCTIPPSTVVPVGSSTIYTATSCVSQGSTALLSARAYASTGSNQTNISCQVGHLQFTSQGATSQTSVSPVVSIDQNGVATANQPGSVLISANISNAASSAGFFSTCPPASITLSAPGTTIGTLTNPVPCGGANVVGACVNQNNPQPLLATAVDTKGVTLTGLSLEYVSTTPTTIPAGSTVTPSLAGAASISAICQPPNCNSSSYNQIGLFGNGKPVTSNSVNITAPGTNSTVLYMASTQSLYMGSRDFTQPAAATPFLLPYLPNSMIISLDGSTIYMGSSTALMVLSAVNTLSMSRTDISSPGTVLAVSPDGSQIVISDPVKQITTIENSSGGVITTYGGVGTRAAYSPDSQTLYIAAANQLLVYSAYTGWTNITPASAPPVGPLVTPVNDVAVTVPSVGAYFAGSSTTARSDCPVSTLTSPTTETNAFYPLADNAAVTTDRIAATNDGKHILGATVSPSPTLIDLLIQIPSGNPNGATVSVTCPLSGTLSFSNTPVSAGLGSIKATAITGVLPTSDSSFAFVTYKGSSGLLPYYAPPSGTANAAYVTLTPATSAPAPTAPISGVLSADNKTFFTGTSGDNLVHLIVPGATQALWIDSGTSLAPNLTVAPSLVTPTLPAGSTVPVDLLVQKPRKTT